MTPISFHVPGIPKAQPRPRAFAKKFGDKYQARVYDAKTAEGWKSQIAIAARTSIPTSPIDGPIRVDIDFIFPRPQRLMRKADVDGEIFHESKPDRDNLEKAVLDCLTTLAFWHDDGQVCDGRVRKLYQAKGGFTGARIRIEPILIQALRSNGELFA